MDHTNLITFFITLLPLILAQQPYIRQAITQCDSTDNSTSAFGYTCNGVSTTCQAYLTFRAIPPYNTVSTISTLLSVTSSQLAQLNSVSENSSFQTDQIVLIPVTCSCSGLYYQANTTYTIRPDDTLLVIANNTFQGLSTCQTIPSQNSNLRGNLLPGTQITVPLRCACPTRNQIDTGFNYLLSYLVRFGEFVSIIGEHFGVNYERILAANGLSDQDTNIYPFTTLLVPLENPPTSSQATAPQPPPPASTPPILVSPPSGGRSSRTWIYVVVGVVGGVGLVSAIVLCIFCCKKRKAKVVMKSKFESVEKEGRIEVNHDEEYSESQDFLDSLSNIAQSLKVYNFKEIKVATEDFSPSLLIKGSVYRGRIKGDLAAIKRMNGDVSKEINLLNKINHFNLIRLSGVCFNEGNWYLVYEYASNGSLYDSIHEKTEGKFLNWNQRLQIALDVATGLNYLHRFTSPPHVHKDLNSGNVLLDRDYRAKIANFGLARSAEGQDGHFALTRHIIGTKGYMAPEYIENGLVSPKLDVYSFGVLLLEILTGKEASELYEDVGTQLSDVLSPVLHEENGLENLRKVIDASLQGNYPPELAVLVFKLIDNCLKKDLNERPNMDDIFQSLSRILGSTMSGEWAVNISDYHTTPR